MEVLVADSISFGCLLLEYQRWTQTFLPVYVLVTYIMIIMSLHLLERISFVRVAFTPPETFSFYSFPMMFSELYITCMGIDTEGGGGGA